MPFIQPIDSFGIVLWEIGSRFLPYPEFQSVAALKHAVCAGTRPDLSVLSDDASSQIKYLTLMHACWASTASNRPKFPEVLRTLNDISINDFGMTTSSSEV